MPCWELFEEQSDEYKESILPKSCKAIVSIEAGSTFGWSKYGTSPSAATTSAPPRPLASCTRSSESPLRLRLRRPSPSCKLICHTHLRLTNSFLSGIETRARWSNGALHGLIKQPLVLSTARFTVVRGAATVPTRSQCALYATPAQVPAAVILHALLYDTEARSRRKTACIQFTSSITPSPVSGIPESPFSHVSSVFERAPPKRGRTSQPHASSGQGGFSSEARHRLWRATDRRRARGEDWGGAAIPARALRLPVRWVPRCRKSCATCSAGKGGASPGG